MEQATFLELLDHVGRLTEVVEKMSTNLVVLNAKLDSNTEKIDRLLEVDLPATAVVTDIEDDGLQDSYASRQPIKQQSMRETEVVDMRDICSQDTPRSIGSASVTKKPVHPPHGPQHAARSSDSMPKSWTSRRPSVTTNPTSDDRYSHPIAPEPPRTADDWSELGILDDSRCKPSFCSSKAIRQYSFTIQ